MQYPMMPGIKNVEQSFVKWSCEILSWRRNFRKWIQRGDWSNEKALFEVAGHDIDSVKITNSTGSFTCYLCRPHQSLASLLSRFQHLSRECNLIEPHTIILINPYSTYLTSSCPLFNPHAYMTRTTFRSGNCLHTHAYTHPHWNKPPYSFHQLISIFHPCMAGPKLPQIHLPTHTRTMHA